LILFVVGVINPTIGLMTPTIIGALIIYQPEVTKLWIPLESVDYSFPFVMFWSEKKY
jgi:hypothetical protein